MTGLTRPIATLKPKAWWEERLAEALRIYNANHDDKRNLADWSIADPRELQDISKLDRNYLVDPDGKVKLNLGSSVVMFHHGIINVDIQPLHEYAHHNGYNFRHADIRQGLAFQNSESVDWIYTSHFLEHLKREDALRFLKDCRRVLKPGGVIRVIVPNATYLMVRAARDLGNYETSLIDDFSELSYEVSKCDNSLDAFYALACENHHALYSNDTLSALLLEAGFSTARNARPGDTEFDSNPNAVQMIKETYDMFPDISLIVEAVVE